MTVRLAVMTDMKVSDLHQTRQGEQCIWQT